jgi:hypothetical protein
MLMWTRNSMKTNWSCLDKMVGYWIENKMDTLDYTTVVSVVKK